MIEAAGRDGDHMLSDLLSGLNGISQADADKRARSTGSYEVAQAKPQHLPAGLFKIVRNSLVILLTALSSISVTTGDARAGTVIAAAPKEKSPQTPVLGL